MAVENPYYAFSDANGHFSIEEIPPGTYRLGAWHPSIKKPLFQTIQIAADGELRVAFQLPSPGERQTAHKIRTPPRFTQAALGRPIDIQPLVEQQVP